MVKPLRLRWVMGLCVFRCILPPALWAEWPGSFTCHCGNTGVERTPNKSRQTNLALKKKILPLLLPGFELATFRSRVRRSYQHAIIHMLYTERPLMSDSVLGCILTSDVRTCYTLNFNLCPACTGLDCFILISVVPTCYTLNLILCLACTGLHCLILISIVSTHWTLKNTLSLSF